MWGIITKNVGPTAPPNYDWFLLYKEIRAHVEEISDIKALKWHYDLSAK